MPWLRALLIGSLVIPVLSGCGDKCVRKGATLKCPDGYVGYGRRTPNRNKDWLPIFALEELATWAADGTYKDGGSCEMACVPAALGEPADLSTCDAFQPCGGDLTGDWRWDAYACPYEVPQNLQPTCATAVQSTTRSTTGTLTFEEDGTVSFRADSVDHIDTVHIPGECLDTFGDCTELGGVGDGCVGDPATGCTCSGPRSSGPDEWEGTWVKSGTAVEIEINGLPATVEYCVNGDELILEWPGDGDLSRVREHLFAWEN